MPRPLQPSVALVIDADAQIRVACSDILVAAGLIVRTAAAGAAGLAELAGGDVDVVVSSVRLPDVTGTDLLRAIRARDEALPVVFVTSWPDFEDGDETVALGGTVASAAFGYRVGRRVRSWVAAGITPAG